MGASDIGAALQWAGRQEGQDRLLVIGDGISTAGEAELGKVAKNLPQAISRIDALLVGGIRDRESAARMVRGTRSHDGVILRDDFSDEEIVRRLGDATATIKVSIEGAAWNWPNTVNGVQPGDEFIVYGAFADAQVATESVVVKIEGSSDITMSSSLVPGQLLTRSVVQAQISRNQNELIEEENKAKKASLQKAIIALSTKYRVLSDYTALLVLESDSDYRRFGIDRSALVDILSVHDTGIRIEQRQRNVPKPRVPATGQFAMRNNNVEPSQARAQAQDLARRAGVLGLFAMPSNNGKAQGFARMSGRPPDFMQAETDRDIYRAIGTVGQISYGTIGHGGQGGVSEQGNWGMTARRESEHFGLDITSNEIRSARRQSGQRNRRPYPQVSPERALVRGGLDAAVVRRYVRRRLARIRFCYAQELIAKPTLKVRVVVQFEIDPGGRVKSASQEGTSDQRLGDCIVAVIKSTMFPTTSNTTKVRYPFLLLPPAAPMATPPASTHTPQATQAWGDTGDTQQLPPSVDPSIAAQRAEAQGPPALTGQMATIHQAIERGAFDQAVASALAWRTEEAGSVMALVALGEALEAADKDELAARAYGSIIDLFPSRADLRRFASARLIALGKGGIELSIDSLKKAAAQRPGHLSVHRLLGYAMLRNGDLEGAFSAIEKGLGQRYPSARFAGGIRILQEDLGIIGQAWLAKNSSKRTEIKTRLLVANSRLATKASLRFVLNWETDANDVDFHIYDGRGGHAFYREPALATGGRLYADVTTGYGPECFAIEGPALAFPYALRIHYYSRGPMGYGMGQVEIMQHDGKGGLKFDTRPFVVMNDNAFVTLEPITKAL
ncbi:MAG: AgmX/PglI C-terminal domain-containing protein [Kofleriaceae bacterium]|nr:AgmX/PglI C-terminal domain-containing protein [Kofleriaceae bacterium]